MRQMNALKLETEDLRRIKRIQAWGVVSKGRYIYLGQGEEQKIYRNLKCPWIREFSGKYPSIFNISRTGRMTLMLLANSQRRPYCTSVNSHSPVGLVSRQWDAVDWACVLCDCRIHNDRESRSASSRQCACPFYSSRAGFLANDHITQVCQPPYSTHLANYDLLFFPKAKTAFEREEICQCDGHTVYTSSLDGASLPTY